MGGLSVRTRFLVVAAVTALPLICLIAFTSIDRYREDRRAADNRAAMRAEQFASLLAESRNYRSPTRAALDRLFTLAAPPAGASIVVFEGGQAGRQAGAPTAGPGLDERVRAALRSRDHVFTATGRDGVERVWGVHSVPRADAAVAYGMPGESVYGAARDALWRNLALVVLALLAALGAAYLAAGNVTRPIRRLAARVGGNGDGHELGRLERGFSQLGEAVESREAELARTAERLATLHEIDRAILDAETPEEVAGAALQRLRGMVGAAHAQVVVLRRGAIGFVVGSDPGARRQGSPQYQRELGVEADDPLLAFADLRAGRDRAYPDIELAPPSPLRERLRSHGIRSHLAVALRAERELVGALCLGFERPDAIDGDVLEAAREVADQIAIALRHASVRSELGAVLDAAMDAILVVDSERRFVSANAAAGELYRTPVGQLIGRRMDDFMGAERAQRDFRAFLERGGVEGIWEGDHGGERLVLDIRGTAEFRPGLHLFVLKDITAGRKLEEQLRQSQKMEAIGQLAGGVAHDFNNLLTVISGYGRLAQRRIGAGPGAHELGEVERATERATQLTRQLLAFSRQQVMDPVTLDLNEVTSGLLPMLDRLIGDDVSVAVLAADDLPSVRADRAQLEQVIITLAINARDAMPTGGTLTIEPAAQDGHVAILRRGLDRQRAAGRHRVAGVDREGDDHLLQLRAVGAHGREVVGGEHGDRHVVADQAIEHRQQPGRDLVEVERDRVHHLLAREREQLARELRGALGRPLDLAQFVRARAGADAALREPAVAADHGQQVVEVMRDAARELADRLHLLRLAQLLLERAPPGDVFEHEQVQTGPELGGAADVEHEVLAAVIALPDALHAAALEEDAEVALRALGAHEVVHPATDQLPDRRPVQLARRGIGRH